MSKREKQGREAGKWDENGREGTSMREEDRWEIKQCRGRNKVRRYAIQDDSDTVVTKIPEK